MALTFAELEEEWEAALDWDERYALLIDIGRQLPPMDSALKTAATKVPGCSANVWVYPVTEGGLLKFQADSDAAITKGIVALVVLMADGKRPEAVLATDFEGAIDRLGLRQHLSSNRTQGLPNMIARVREAAARMAA
ncbi:SufE family protein [Sandaracinobacter sp. RS1-74]|uniref:SufE family protein n=1 Tax=Sandaracinobacteroides sayramensis TaxID=2913411 RepID=UPI001EDC793D|nr:SufE family protein [Sandaracinobacteroides sayramensis]MCG2840095.1 SufE family protein [Sandaracinobacteroides sayramensis]